MGGRGDSNVSGNKQSTEWHSWSHNTETESVTSVTNVTSDETATFSNSHQPKGIIVKVELISSLVWHSFSCSGLDKNVKSFSSAVVPLADSLKRSSDVAVKRAIACALERLSRDPYNCFIIHQHDALKVKQIFVFYRVCHCSTNSMAFARL